jgi:hypothetical protein
MRKLLLFLLALPLLAQTHSATLSWTNATSNPAGTTVLIYRQAGTCPTPAPTTTAGFTAIATGLTGSSYFDTDVTAGASYCYVAVSVSGSSTSAPSNDAQAVIPATFPPGMFSVTTN